MSARVVVVEIKLSEQLTTLLTKCTSAISYSRVNVKYIFLSSNCGFKMPPCLENNKVCIHCCKIYVCRCCSCWDKTVRATNNSSNKIPSYCERTPFIAHFATLLHSWCKIYFLSSNCGFKKPQCLENNNSAFIGVKIISVGVVVVEIKLSKQLTTILAKCCLSVYKFSIHRALPLQ